MRRERDKNLNNKIVKDLPTIKTYKREALYQTWNLKWHQTNLIFHSYCHWGRSDIKKKYWSRVRFSCPHIYPDINSMTLGNKWKKAKVDGNILLPPNILIYSRKMPLLKKWNKKTGTMMVNGNFLVLARTHLLIAHFFFYWNR